MKELINTFSKDLEEIKEKQTEMNNTATEIKNTLEDRKGMFRELK